MTEPMEPVCLKVIVIESPSSADLFDGRFEGGILIQSLGLFDIPARLRLVIDMESFIRSIREDVGELIEEDGCVPVIHLSGHGNKHGFQLTDGTFLTWTELSEVFRSINQAVSGKLVVCLSCCEGFTATHCALFANPLPFASLVGNTGSPTWAEAAVAFTTFYHLLRCGRQVKDAVEGMKAASGNEEFRVMQGSDIVSLRQNIEKLGGIEKVLDALRELREKQGAGQ